MTKLQNGKSYEQFYVARQPIFDRVGNTWGYELLFRSGSGSDRAEISDQDFATMCVATCGFVESQRHVDQTKKICINFTENLILQGAARGLPPSVAVIEVLETVVPTDRILEELICLKQQGYLVAVDDYMGAALQNPLLDIADIIKVDLLGKEEVWIKDIYASIQDKNALKLAEKVDNRETLAVAKEIGFDLYQGFFFSQPENFSGRTLRSSDLSRFRILQLIDNATVSAEELLQVIAADTSITYRLLRFLNSAAFGFSMKISSVRHAIVLLGSNRLRYWLRMVVMSDMLSANQNPELALMALNRGKFLEELALEKQIIDAEPETMALFGMLSLIDTMLEMPFEKILSELPLSQQIKSGYIEAESRFAGYLQLTAALERGETSHIIKMCESMDIEQTVVGETSLRATAWTNSMANHLFS